VGPGLSVSPDALIFPGRRFRSLLGRVGHAADLDCLGQLLSFWTNSFKKNRESFIAFLKYLLVKQHSIGCCVLVLDNAPYHTELGSFPLSTTDGCDMIVKRHRCVAMPLYDRNLQIRSTWPKVYRRVFTGRFPVILPLPGAGGKAR
jgi:hypothetical protein